MRKWWSGIFFVLLALNVNADSNDFFVVPVKTLRFIQRSNKRDIIVPSYSLLYDTRFDCLDVDCGRYRGNSSSTTEISGTVGDFKTLPIKIPRMPNSGPLMLTFSVPGICQKTEKCSVSISYEKFLKAEEPVVFIFDYDEKASKNFRKKRQEAEAQSLNEIQEKLGSVRKVSSLSIAEQWKKFGEDFLENRKKLNPMTYTADSVARLGLSNWVCGPGLQEKINQCSVHACIYTTDQSESKAYSDLVIHGLNKAGNCVISLPNGKRFFVPKAELASFYDAFICQQQKGLSGSCKDKKLDLLGELKTRHLAIEYVPILIGVKDDE